jgi:hypothetical protein
LFQLFEPNHLLLIFTPWFKEHVGESISKWDHLRIGLQDWIGPVTALQLVVGDARIEVVDMVKTDIPGKPLEQPRQPVSGSWNAPARVWIR